MKTKLWIMPMIQINPRNAADLKWLKEDRKGGRKGKGDRTLGERFRRIHRKNTKHIRFPHRKNFIQ